MIGKLKGLVDAIGESHAIIDARGRNLRTVTLDRCCRHTILELAPWLIAKCNIAGRNTIGQDERLLNPLSLCPPRVKASGLRPAP